MRLLSIFVLVFRSEEERLQAAQGQRFDSLSVIFHSDTPSLISLLPMGDKTPTSHASHV